MGPIASFDLEDWYRDVEHTDALPTSVAHAAFERQVAEIERLLDVTRTRATFFVLGRTAERHPDVVRRLHASGHEIASHGYGHARLGTLGRSELRDDIERAAQILAELTGRRPLGYRAPYLSATPEVARDLYDVLAAVGVRYSSSVLPVAARGQQGHPLGPVDVAVDGATVREVPLSALEMGSARVPVAGGGYLRVAPAWLVRRIHRALEARGASLVLYAHPHELDPEPLVTHRGPVRALYVNLGRRSVPAKLELLFRQRRFAPFRDALGLRD